MKNPIIAKLETFPRYESVCDINANHYTMELIIKMSDTVPFYLLAQCSNPDPNHKYVKVTNDLDSLPELIIHSVDDLDKLSDEKQWCKPFIKCLLSSSFFFSDVISLYRPQYNFKY